MKILSLAAFRMAGVLDNTQSSVIDISTVNLALSLSFIIHKLIVQRYWHSWKQ